MEDQSLYQQRDVRPIPDPTTLTNELVSRARDDIRRELDAIRVQLQLSLDGNKGLYMERFLRVEETFKTVDQRFQGVTDKIQLIVVASKEASGTTLQATKDLQTAQNINTAQTLQRIETQLTKQIEQLVTLINTRVDATEGKITDIKERQSAVEGRAAGIGTSWGVIVVVAGLVIAVVSIVFKVLR